MSVPLVSIVIPTFNYGRFVGLAVDSALAQTYPNVEVIVVDDGSTDDTVERLEKYGERIRVIRQPNKGLSAARNTGIRAARGEFIALLDSDDAFHPQKIEYQVLCLGESTSQHFLATDHVTGQSVPEWTVLIIVPSVKRVELSELAVKARFGSCGVLVKKSCFEEVGGFDETLRSAEDRDMWIRIASRYPIAMLEAPLWFYRMTPGSMSRNAAVMEENELRVLEKAFALPELKQRKTLRRRAYALAASSAGFMYLDAGMNSEAVRRIVRSLWLWPIPFSRLDVNTRLVRIRLLAAALRRLIIDLATLRQPR